jgi:hypothetical protein
MSQANAVAFLSRLFTCRSAAGAWAGALAMLAMLVAAPPARAHFVDDFNRADGASIGNGWIEKNDAAFTLAGGQVAKQVVGTFYRDNIVYRPDAENALDVEASLEFTLLTALPGYPQIIARLQTNTAASADAFEGYMLYLPDSGTSAIIGRQTGNAFVATLTTMNFTQALNTTDRYRLRLRVTGTNPVQLSGFVERLAGGIWQTIGQAGIADAAANRIAAAGSVGFGGYVESAYRYDNFARVDIGAIGTPNPAPAAAGLAPSGANAGESGFPVVVYGSGFTTDSTVRWNGSNRVTTYVSPSELEAFINTADLATAGNSEITVFNPAPAGGLSQALTFQVLSAPPAPAPAITALNPNAVTAGAAGFVMTVTGSGFTADSTVRWNGTGLATTFIATNELRADVAASNVASAGTFNITVLRAADGQVSSSATFTVSAAPPAGAFLDTFARADSATIGNGWVEKAAAAFSIAGNEAAKVAAGGGDYRNNIVYRPAAEDLLDVEASVELRFLSMPVGYPQLMIRAQAGTIATFGQLDAYLLYVNDSATQAVLARQRGGGWDTPLAIFALSSAFNTTDRFRLRLRAEGTNPVQLGAFVERLVSGSWQIIGQATFSDVAAARIATAGSVGFGGYIETNYRYDNFSRTPLGSISSNPVPVAGALNPASATAGSTAIQLAVTGSGFVPASVVRWNGSNRTTTYVSATQINAQITATDLAAAGSGAVSVFNPAPGGGTSGDLTFTINALTSNPVPVATSLNPASVAAGSGAFNLTVLGSGFVAGSVVRWNGADRATTLISSGELRAAITATDVSTAGTANVAVLNPTPGGGLSGIVPFQIAAANNPAPVTSSLMPTSAQAGSAALTLTVSGSGFIGASNVRWNGSDRPTTFISANELRASIAAADLTTAATRTVTVFNPAPGGGTSNGQTFTITAASPDNPVPQVTQLNPNSQPTGGSAFTLSVLGSGFTTQSVVRWNGQARTTTLVSSTELRANIPGTDIAAAGLTAITVSNPTPGGGLSSPLTFFIQDGSVAYFFDGFNRANNAVIGNSWTEKYAAAFSLQDGEVVSTTTPDGFTYNIMYRPAAEDRLNVENSVEFRRLPNQNVITFANYPQLHARVQQNTVAQFNTLDSYIFFIDDLSVAPRAMFAITRTRPDQWWECYIQALPLPSALVVGSRYRLRFTVTGTAPVVLSGSVDQYSNGAWITMASGTATHSLTTQRDPSLYCDQPIMPAPITDAGGSGLAKWTNRRDVYDNFFWREVEGVPSPPTISALNPASRSAGSGAFTLVVNGTGFSTGSVVRWNGSARTTTFISSTEVRASITANDVLTSGLAAVTVFQSSSGQSSNQYTFDILPASGQQTLFDNFDRADSAAIGNGWIEKNAGAFALQSGRVSKLLTPGGDYRDNIVYRPSAEDLLNAESSLEFRVLNANIGYPAILVRVQANTVNFAQRFDGYILYMNSSANQAIIARQAGTGYDTPLAPLSLSEPLNLVDTYRMRLSATGTNPVQLRAYVERWNGSSWQVLAQATVNDSAAQRIASPGAVGFGGDIENSYTFDNFRRIDLGP